MTEKRLPDLKRSRILLISLALTFLLTGAGGYVFFHKRIGDWMILCSGKTASENRSCRLSAPLPILANDKPQNILVISEPSADKFRIELDIRDIVAPGLPAFVRIDGFAVHQGAVTNGKAVWTGQEALAVLGEMRAGRSMVFRVQTAPDGLPRDTHVSLAGFRDALSTYRGAIRTHGLLGTQ